MEQPAEATARASLSTPSFGLVILNWNNAKDTIECLDTLATCDPAPESVVVVDNGSEDDSVPLITSWIASHQSGPTAQRMMLIKAGANLGFAGGNNVGIARLLNDSPVSHVLLLNNDASVAPKFFADLTEAIAKAHGAGVIGPTILEDPDRTRVWYAGGVEHRLRALVEHTLSVPRDEEPRDTDFVTGCAMVISRSALDRAGLLPECYFPAYFEDGDYCHRARAAGFRVVYAPRPVVYHKVGSTIRAANLALQLNFHKNRLRVIYVRRNYHGVTKAAALLYLAITKPARALVDTLRGEPRSGWAVLRGAVSGFTARGIAVAK
ncbi:MAG TPA: glycosyltransferase family 2 protein [Gemmatimonadaceae bacterium]|nr:glycosyltransferase family 2 protein [Gemmatimonadaceae bacterium]